MELILTRKQEEEDDALHSSRILQGWSPNSASGFFKFVADSLLLFGNSYGGDFALR